MYCGLSFHEVNQNATGYIAEQEMIHYEIPFERGYTVLFPLSYSVNNAEGYIT